ncbi:MFS general substrate transporter [Lichtheimia hyalospora FSU 10163]|nr:MFS general substrate transporter [Lichtheimia hyalospora FSU 10163]
MKTKQKDDDDESNTAFSKSQRAVIVAITVFTTAMLTALPINIYYPALSAMKKDLNTTTEKINLTVTVYIVMQAIAPAIWGPIADRSGRRPMYLLAILVYTASCTGLALAPTYSVLLVMRLLQSFGGSPTVAIGSGIIGDISTPSTRGTYFGIQSGVRQVITTAAPMLGGIITEALSWRWIWWIMVISGCVMFLLMFFFVPETLQSLVVKGDGFISPTPTQWWQQRQQRKKQQSMEQSTEGGSSLNATGGYGATGVSSSSSTVSNAPQKQPRVNRLKSLQFLMERDVACSLVFIGIGFGCNQTMLVATSSILTEIYQLSVLNVGLCFMAAGVGSFVSALVTGRVLDYEFKRIAIQQKSTHDDQHIPKRGYLPPSFPIFTARLRISMYASIIMSLSLVAFGWCVFTVQPLPVLLLVIFIVSVVHTNVFNSVQTLIVDLFPADSSAITASNNLVRCALGATGTAVIEPGIQAMGVQWMFLTIGLIVMASTILPILLFKYGVGWRRQRIEREARRHGAAEQD